MTNLRILIAGEGGQGIQVISKLLVEGAYKSKRQVTYLPNFGVEQRGGVSLGFVQISDFPISFPKFQKADIVVVLSERSFVRIEKYLSKDTIIIFDNSLMKEESLGHLKVEKIAIPASFMAKTKLTPRVFNIIILAALTEMIREVKTKIVKDEMKKFFLLKYLKEPQLKHFNEKAFEMGVATMKGLVK